MTFALWMVAIGGLLPVFVVLIAKQDPGLDIHNPRDVHAGQTGLRKRAHGAHLNGLEAFPLFAAAVLAAEISAATQGWLNLLAGAWLLVRVSYTTAYLCDWAKVRVGLWFVGVLLSAAIFILAGAT